MTPSLFETIHKLSTGSKNTREFCQAFLETVTETLGADAGVVWEASSNEYQPIGQYTRAAEPSRLPLTQEAHSKLLLQAASASAPISFRPGEKNGKVPETNPLLLLGRFSYGGNYIVELVVNGSALNGKQQTGEVFAGALDAATRAGEEVDFDSLQVQQPQAAAAERTQRNLSQAEISSYLSAVHKSIDRSMTCMNVANETRRVFECDRVSVLLKYRGKFRLFAISGQPSVNRRSNTTKLLEKLARRLLKTGQSFWYPSEADVPSQVSEVLDEYLSISATRSLVVEPIYEKVEDAVQDPESLERKSNLVVGGIVYEHCHERWDRSEIESVIEFVSLHNGNAIRNSQKHHGLFLYPVLNLLSKSRLLVAPRMLPKTLLVCLGILLALLALRFWPVDFYVSAEGILIPKEVRPVFSKVDGDVSQLLVEHGASVSKGDPLIVLTSREHEIRAKDLESKILSSQQRLEMIQDKMFEKREDSRAVEENIEAIKAQIANFIEQKAILQEITNDMQISSPLDGQVISWDLKQRLQGRAISRGQELLEVAAINGEWQLEIELPVRRYSHLVRELQTEAQPRVSFLLAADTSKRYSGRIIEVEETASLNSSNEQFIRLKASLESEDLKIEQARTGVTTKIYCGKTCLGYLWLHDIGEFIQKNVLFRIR